MTCPKSLGKPVWNWSPDAQSGALSSRLISLLQDVAHLVIHHLLGALTQLAMYMCFRGRHYMLCSHTQHNTVQPYSERVFALPSVLGVQIVLLLQISMYEMLSRDPVRLAVSSKLSSVIL